MTIDEAIKNFEEIAELHEERYKFYEEHDMPEYIRSSRKYASEHRQFAEWLRELKAYREAREEIGFLPIVWEEGAEIQKCIGILDKHLREVNTDEDSD